MFFVICLRKKQLADVSNYYDNWDLIGLTYNCFEPQISHVMQVQHAVCTHNIIAPNDENNPPSAIYTTVFKRP